ncbi:MAG: aspartate ammonia-lyase [Acidobacteria bacterium]|nr:aspartate ammonia-lyase [Acidobacteriota bacterium]MCA1611266.1 aspartate ammonia-lyase [Acidobacteriota bacterium]
MPDGGILRQEKDSLGIREIPEAAYWGAQTSRAIENYPISGERPHPEMVRAYTRIKKACAETNLEFGRLTAEKARAIGAACDDVLAGGLADQFVVDVYQAGAGTSFHMNVNEVLAGRAAEILGKPRGDRAAVNPNDDVNLGQSTNDTFPTALHMAAVAVGRLLAAEVARAADALERKGVEFAGILKSGRTHLMDAVPVTLGQEFRAYGAAVAHRRAALDRSLDGLLELALGGSAAGTGLNTPPGFREKAIARIAELSGERYVPAGDPREAMQSRAAAGDYSAALRALAVELGRLSNDLRLLASGPSTGLDEIRLPPVQPGSSIMPGKVNPSLLECLNMLCFQIIGMDSANLLAVGGGQLELNVMMPLLAHNLTRGPQLLVNFLPVVRTRCIDGITANPEKCRHYLEESPSVITALTPKIGYAKAAEIFKEAVARGVRVREVLLEKKVVTEKELEEAMAPSTLLGPLA